MIQASDLRTGNILKYFIGEEGLDWQETTIDAQDILWCQQNNDNFNKVHKPVELSDSILLVCGFTKDNYGCYYIPLIEPNQLLWTKFYTADNKSGWSFSISIGFAEDMQGLPDTNNLHELQNLFFAIHKTELTYNPSK